MLENLLSRTDLEEGSEGAYRVVLEAMHEGDDLSPIEHMVYHDVYWALCDEHEKLKELDGRDKFEIDNVAVYFSGIEAPQMIMWMFDPEQGNEGFLPKFSSVDFADGFVSPTSQLTLSADVFASYTY